MIKFVPDKKTVFAKHDIFEVKPAEKIISFSPEQNEVINPFISNGSVTLRWEDPNHGKKYLVEIASDKNFSKIIQTGTTKNRTYKTPPLKPGKFYWRIKLPYKTGTVLASSDTRKANMAEKLNPPAIIFPKNKAVIDMTFRNNLPFSWKKVPSATSYRLTLFQFKGGFNKKIFTASPERNSYKFNDLKMLDVGNFFLEIEAFRTHKKKIISQSRKKKYYFSLKLQEPEEEELEIITPDVIFVQ